MTAAAPNSRMTTELLETLEISRDRIRQIFRFLKDFNGLRNPVKRQISEQPWSMWLRDLPDHPFVRLRRRKSEPESNVGADNTGDVVLRVRRAQVPLPPAVPEILTGWLPVSWRDPVLETIEPLQERQVPTPNGYVSERFDQNRDRMLAFERWRVDRDQWANEALPAQQALDIFNRLYELQGRLEREGESVQLVLGQGILLWQRQEGDIRHPIALQKLQLAFDPLIPEFSISETGQPPELIRPLLCVSQEVAAQTIKQADEEFAKQDLDLLDSDQIEGALRRVAAALDSKGQFVKEAPGTMRDYPQIWCDPVIYVHRRTQGFAVAIDHVLEDLAQRTEFPPGLLRISGIEPPLPEFSETTRRAPWEEPVDILFTKEANEEQVQIADRLGRHKNVLVQGPPGTGKTHTIANLVGHLLAQGKRVLVTAHTSKALRVLREKVVEPLQTLCVSVLDNEIESRRQLEASVDSMVARLSSEDPDFLDRQAAVLRDQREQWIHELSRFRHMLIQARQDEYRDVVVAGVGASPSVAARFVAETASQNSWIPGPIEPGVPSPLSDSEVLELYSTNLRMSVADEAELSRWRPLPGNVPGAEEFAEECERWRSLQESDRTTGAQLWDQEANWDVTTEELMLIEERLRDSIGLLANAPAWKLDALAAGFRGFHEPSSEWEELVAKIDRLHSQSRSSLNLLLDYRCTLELDLSPEMQRTVASEIRTFLESGGKLSFVNLMTKSGWRKFIASAQVNDHPPSTLAHFRALEAFTGLAEMRRSVGVRWANQITRRSGPHWEEFGERPEEGTVLLIPVIRKLVGWHSQSLLPLIEQLSQAGFQWDEFIDGHEIPPGEHMEARRLVDAVVHHLPHIVAARINALHLIRLNRKFQQWNRELFAADPNRLPASTVLDLRVALSTKDYLAYDLAYRKLASLYELSAIFDRRKVLIDRMRGSAASWANAIEGRRPPHNTSEPSGPAGAAWKWLQFRQELDRRASTSIPELQKKIHQVQQTLRHGTARLIELQSWSAQCKRVGLEQRQALQGWKDINRRIGRGTGQRVPGLRLEARRTLAKARNAVPVWIMPLSRVAETFDPRTTRFDVVVVDEASQCDVLGMLALYLAEQAVVVGDHEQVSPTAVGQEISEVEHLIAQHLTDIPNKKLYDGKTSIYDLARQSFGGLIRLLEHFRCVPEIISFSNILSYQGAIKALRDATSTNIRPSVVAYRLSGLRGEGKVNSQEVRTIVALLQAATDQPEYRGKSFGAVSLLGEEQAFEIEKLVRQMLPPDRVIATQFLCGTAAQFQGDERDVIFLSVVDSPKDGPLPMRQEDMYRQRFNVAASRAKDQLWVVHSLDATRDVKPGDLRRRLIEHAEDPGALLKLQLGQEARTESEFERLVLQRLVRERFQVYSQWAVGHYRIDLVVEGNGRRLAVECDGDRFHPIEKLAEDMARQAVLERIGWRFVRIRGSQFFRDPDGAMKPVFETLSDMGIAPRTELASVDAPAAKTDLLDRIKRRAAEILASMEEQANRQHRATPQTPSLQ